MYTGITSWVSFFSLTLLILEKGEESERETLIYERNIDQLPPVQISNLQPRYIL